MASKNEIRHRISLEGDEDVKRRLKAVGEAGKQSMADIEKRLDAARRGAGGKPVQALSEAIAPLTEASGLAGAAGILGRLSSSIFSPTGLIAGITSALLGMAKLGDETQRQKDRFKSFGDTEGFAKVSEQAKKLGTDISSLQSRRERYIATVQEHNAKNSSFGHPPNYVPGKAEETAAGVRILGAGPSNSAPPKTMFQDFDRALFELIRKDVGDADQARQLTGQFEDALKKSGLTGDSLRSLRLDAPSAANFITKSLSQLLGRGFANPAELAALLDRGTKVSQFDLVAEGAKRAPEADKEAKEARGVSEAFDAVRAASGRLAASFGGDHAGLTKGIDSTARLIDEAAGGVEKFLHAGDNAPGGKKAPESLADVFTSDKGDLLGRFVGLLRENASTGNAKGLFGLPLELPRGNPLGVITSPITDFLSKLFGWSSAATKAADELSKASGALPTVTYGKGDGKSEEVQKALDKFRHFNGGLIDFQKVDPEAAALIRGMGDRNDGSLPKQGPSNEQQLSGMLTNQKQLGEAEGLFQEKLNPLIADQTGEGADSIEKERSKQRGIVGGADLSERLYPEGPSNLRYRRLDDPNYQPPELGTYDENMNFIPAKKQPYPKVPGMTNVYDTKGFGDFNPIYNSGAPNPLSFPHYLDDLRKSLSPESVPLPQSRPDEAPPPEQHSEIDNQQDVADSASAFNEALGSSTDGLKQLAGIIADVRGRLQNDNNDTAGQPKTVTFATGGPVARWFDGGGHVSGPGTTTSDSIPAWLSDKEYVIQASAAKKVGRGFLDWINAGAPGFADGGSVIGSSTGGVLGPGSHDVTYDPQSGGAYIDGNLHLPGDPLLNDPDVKQAMQESMQGMGQQSSQKKHKSLFTGIFGGHVFGESGSYADGGAVGNVPTLSEHVSRYFARLAGGGSVDGSPTAFPQISLPQIDLPTLDYGDVPDLGSIGGGTSEALHPVTIDLGGGREVNGLRAPTDIVRQLSREAKDSANARIGRAPSWVYGPARR